MQRKWEAMYYLQKILGFPVVALCLAVPSLASADTIVTTQSYVTGYAVAKNQGTGTNNANVGKTLVVNNSGNLELGTITGLPSGTSAQILQHNGTSWTATGLGTTAITTAPGYDANKLVAAGVIADAISTAVSTKQNKPTQNIAEGKYLRYTGDSADDVEANYVMVPNFDPSSGTIPNNPTFSYFWLQ